MKLFSFTVSALMLTSAVAAPAMKIEKFELDGYKFESFNSSAKSLGNGAFELTIKPGTSWPMIHIAPPAMPADADTVSITVQQIAPAGRSPRRIFIEYDPKKELGSEALQSVLSDNKPRVLTATLKKGVKFRRFSFNVNNPPAPVVLKVSNIKVYKNDPLQQAKKAKETPMPPVIFKGKPFFPIGMTDLHPLPRTEHGVDPGFLLAGGNMGDIGFLGLPGHEWYAKHRQPVMFKRLEYAKTSKDFQKIAWVVGIDSVLVTDMSKSDKQGLGGMAIPLNEQQIKERSEFLVKDIQKLSKHPNVIGYSIDEPENLMYRYFKTTPKFAEWETRREAPLCELIVQTYDWIYKVIRKEHPGAKMMPIIGWWTSYDKMPEFYDINMPNSYPSGKKGSAEFDSDFYSVNYDAAMAVKAARKAGNGKTVVYMPGFFIRWGDSRTPTLREMRYCSFAPITRGAMGVYGWRLLRCNEEYRDNVVYPIMSELDEMKNYFLGEWHDEKVFSDHDTASVEYLRKFKEYVTELEGSEDGKVMAAKALVPDVSYCLRRDPATGKYLLLAVNNRKEAVTVTFRVDLDNLPRAAKCAIDRHQVRIKNGRFTDKFEPFDVHAYIIEMEK